MSNNNNFFQNNWKAIVIIVLSKVIKECLVPYLKEKKIFPLGMNPNMFVTTLMVLGITLEVFFEFTMHDTIDLNAINPSDVFEEVVETCHASAAIDGFCVSIVPEPYVVDIYIKLSKIFVFSTEYWDMFTDNEVNYILNGIYAYEGREFPKDYFKRYKWYNPHISEDDFTADMLNSKQHKNIANILVIMKRRGLR